MLADEATVLDSNRSLQIAGLKVPAGPHTIWVLPTAAQWTLIVSKDASGWKIAGYFGGAGD